MSRNPTGPASDVSDTTQTENLPVSSSYLPDKPSHNMRRFVYPLATSVGLILANIASEKWASGIPDGLFLLLSLFALSLWLYWLWTHEKIKKYRRLIYTYPVMSLMIMVAVGACVGGGMGALLWRSVFRQQPSASTSDQTKTPDPPLASANAVAALSGLGWTVRPGTDEIQFEIAFKPLPPMKESATYFRQLQKPFRLHLQGVKSIEGLHEIADIVDCTKIEINAGEFSDISELRGFSGLTSLTVSQTPFNGLSVVDASPLMTLTNLRRLVLSDTKVQNIDALRGLTNLEYVNLHRTLIRDISPLANHNALKSLEIRETELTDLSAISDIQTLNELTISGKQLPGLTKLTKLTGLKRLIVIDQSPVDLSPVRQLTGLEYLWLLTVRFDVKPLHSLVNLRELTLIGVVGLYELSDVTDIQGLANLRELRKLTFGSLNVNDISFVANLGNLEELNISQLPISSIAPLRSLQSLKSVTLTITGVTDISPLLDLPLLTNLNVMRTPVRADLLTRLEQRGVKVQR